MLNGLCNLFEEIVYDDGLKVFQKCCCGILNGFKHVSMWLLRYSGWFLGDCFLIQVQRVHLKVSVMFWSVYMASV